MTLPVPRRPDDALPPEPVCQLTERIFRDAHTGDFYRAAVRLAAVLDEARTEAYERGLAAATRTGAV